VLTVRGYVCRKLTAKTAHSRAWLAEDAQGRTVFLKELRFATAPNAKVLEAFEREAHLLRQLRHPAIPRFLESFSEGEGPRTRLYLVQELVEGHSLAEELQRGPLPEAEARDMARQVLDILVYLQSLSPKVIHRDVKPLNLLRRLDGSIALVDFGAARDLTRAVTHGATLVGTFGYMPLEQLGGTVDETTDLYGLGATLVHLLGQRPPWELLAAGHDADLTRALRVSPAFRLFLRRLVAPLRQDRFGSAAEARQALDNPAAPRGAWRRRLTVLGGVAAALAVGFFFLPGGLFRQDAPPKQPPAQARAPVTPARTPEPAPPSPGPELPPAPIEPPPEAFEAEFPLSRFASDTCEVVPLDLEVDPAGNVLWTGLFDTGLECVLDFGRGPLRHRGRRDVFLASFSPTGALRYSLSFGEAMSREPAPAGAVPRLDASGFITGSAGGGYLSKSFVEADPWGNALMVLGNRPVLLKLSPAGELLWQYPLGGRFYEGLAVDMEGSAYVLGMDGQNGEGQCELLKVDAHGKPVWRQVVLERSHACFGGVEASPDGQRLVVYIERGGLTPQSWKTEEREMYLVVLNPAGEISSRRPLEVDRYLRIEGMAVGADGGVHLVGHGRDRERRILSTLLVSLPADGGVGRVRRIESPVLRAYHVAVAPDGEVLLTGRLEKPLTLEGHLINPMAEGGNAVVLGFRDEKLSRATVLPLPRSSGSGLVRLPRGDALITGVVADAGDQGSLFLQPLPGFYTAAAPALLKEGPP
jgi:hypothetical protein